MIAKHDIAISSIIIECWTAVSFLGEASCTVLLLLKAKAVPSTFFK